MTHVHPVPSRTRAPEESNEASESEAQQQISQPANFIAGMFSSLKRAGLGRFFGVAPPVTQGRSDSFGGQDPACEGDNAETRQAKDIYQAMLDITGH